MGHDSIYPKVLCFCPIQNGAAAQANTHIHRVLATVSCSSQLIFMRLHSMPFLNRDRSIEWVTVTIECVELAVLRLRLCRYE